MEFIVHPRFVRMKNLFSSQRNEKFRKNVSWDKCAKNISRTDEARKLKKHIVEFILKIVNLLRNRNFKNMF